MFRSYWERAAKVTGERIADLSARPMAAVGRGARDPEPGPRNPPPVRRSGSRAAVPSLSGPHPRALESADQLAASTRRTRKGRRGRLGDERGLLRTTSDEPSRCPHRPPAVASAFASARLWIVDLDGVIWLYRRAHRRCRRSRRRAARRGASGWSSPPTTRLPPLPNCWTGSTGCGVAAEPEDLASSAGAAASLLDAGQSVRVLAEGGVLEALDAAGRESVAEDGSGRRRRGRVEPDRSISTALAPPPRRPGGRAAWSGPTRIPTHPTPDGLVPGSGALLAAVATASGVVPEIAGKPHEPMAALMRQRFGFEAGDRSVVMVGDQPRTDGRLAQRLGIAFGLVDSGVTRPAPRRFDTPVAAAVRPTS